LKSKFRTAVITPYKKPNGKRSNRKFFIESKVKKLSEISHIFGLKGNNCL
jgi:hypothetical protein